MKVKGHQVAMLGAGLIGDLYTSAIHGRRSLDRVSLVYSRTMDSAQALAAKHEIGRVTTDLRAAIFYTEVDVVVIALPNNLHEEAVSLAAEAGKAVLCTKPLGRNAEEARRMLESVERAGVFAGYLEDLCFTPKTLDALAATRAGALGEIVSVRSREAHAGPHSAWFKDGESAGGGVLLDLGSHCVEIIRSFVGKNDLPIAVTCWTATRTPGVDVEDNAFALVQFESGAVGQIDVSWTARGGMDLRDEINGTEGTLRLDHFMYTGFELFTTSAGAKTTEKADATSGWQFPVADDLTATGNVDMFVEMFNAMDEGRPPSETFFDGYVVNAVLDACYRAAKSGATEKINLFRHS